MKPGSGNRQGSSGAGPGAAHVLQLLAINGAPRPGCWASPAFGPGAICPAAGKAAGIVMPRCNSEAMSMDLEEIACHVAPGAHAVNILDQAGWHGSAELVVPSKITLLPLPPRYPEVHPVENVWQFMRDNRLSYRIYKSYDDIVDHCCFAWNNLVNQARRIMSIGMRHAPCRNGYMGHDQCALV